VKEVIGDDLSMKVNIILSGQGKSIFTYQHYPPAWPF
jgi:hypothetical protein